MGFPLPVPRPAENWVADADMRREGRRGEDKTLLDNGCIIMKRIQLGEGTEGTEPGGGRRPVNKHRRKQSGWLGTESNLA